MPQQYQLGDARSQGLVDLLDRILDRGLVVAGDIRIRLADVELLTIQVRLLVCSIDKAEEIGMNWWRTDPFFARPEGDHALPDADGQGQALGSLSDKLDRLHDRLDALEQKKLDE